MDLKFHSKPFICDIFNDVTLHFILDPSALSSEFEQQYLKHITIDYNTENHPAFEKLIKIIRIQGKIGNYILFEFNI